MDGKSRVGEVPEVFVLDDFTRSQAAFQAFAGSVVELIDEVEGSMSSLRTQWNSCISYVAVYACIPISAIRFDQNRLNLREKVAFATLL